jgi:hypothetical protein
VFAPEGTQGLEETQCVATGRGLTDGVAVVADGSEYRGNWVDGYRHGKGTFTYPAVAHAQRPSKLEHELRYEGSWRTDKREGEGVLYYGGTHGCHIVAPPPDDVRWRL